MGSYLSEPITEKVSTDESNDRLKYGASSMQGWRVDQEDAHNCLLDFDANTSLFAVYDGHGGREVAIYCSEKLPDFLKALQTYKDGQLKEALVDGFLGFDATIASREVVEILKELSLRKNSDDVDDEDDDDDDNVDNLCEEAKIPIEKIMEQYRNNLLTKPAKTESPVEEKVEDAGKPGGSQVKESAGCTSSESTVESSNGSVSESKQETPDSSSDKKVEELHQNGDVLPDSAEQAKESDGVTSSSMPVVNGQVNKKGKGKALAKTKGVKSPEVKSRPKRSSVKQMYAKLLDFGDDSEDSEDEEDKTFEGPNDESSDDDDEPTNVVEGEETSDEDDEEDDEDDDDDDEDDADLEFAKNMVEEPGSDSGCTAVVAILKDNNLYVANAGDSRCIVCRSGKAIEMSIDHKPEDEAENERVVKAGGKVTADGRVNGGLNLSRAIGDHAYKQNKELSDKDQMITALPDVRTLTINPNEDEFMVLACDGIWNFMSSQEVVDFVRPSIKEGKQLSKICEEMFDHCLAPNTMGDGTGCDNMTAIIVEFKSTILKRTASPEKEAENVKRAKTDEAEVDQA